jgi:Fe-S-cluster-containing hydrogenase component 2
MNYQKSPIFTEKTQCQDCYKASGMPVKAIRVENGHAMIIAERCVLCGHCVTACPAGAKRYVTTCPRATASHAETQSDSLAGTVVRRGVSRHQRRANHFSTEKSRLLRGSETAIGADLVSAKIAEDLQQAGNPGRQKLLRLQPAR